MKAIFLQVAIVCFLAITAVGQQEKYTIEKLRSIDLLTTTREDLRVILAEFRISADEEGSESFSSGGLGVEINYTSGVCESVSERDFDYWTVPIGRTSFIEVRVEESFTPKELGLVVSSFKKEPRFEGSTSRFIYFDKELGVAFETEIDEGIEVIESLTLFPRRKKRILLCDESERARKFYETPKIWFDGESLKRPSPPIYCPVPSVEDLKLSTDEISGSAKRTVDVVSVISNPNDDPLTHKFIVTAGSIRGKGTNVLWDLTGVSPGTYTITAAVDDGCGFCGRTATRSVVVR